MSAPLIPSATLNFNENTSCMAWGPKGMDIYEYTVAIGLCDGEVSLVNAKTGDQLNFSAHELGVESITWAVTNNSEVHLVTGGQDGQLKIWNIKNDKNDYQINVMRAVKAKSCWVENVVWIHSKSILAFSSGKYLTCCTLSGDTVTEYPAAGSTISDLKWSNSFDCLLVCYYGTVALVNPEKVGFLVELEDKGSFVSVGSSNNHLLIASGMQDQMISIWGLVQDRKLIPGKKKSIETMKEVDFTTFRIQYPGKVSQIDFNGSGQMMAGTGGSQLIVWNFGPGGAYMLGENGAKNTVFFSHKSRINHVAFHPRSKYVASMDEDGLLFIWSLETAKANYVRTSKFHFVGQDNDGLTFEWSKDGSYLAAAFGDGNVRIFNPRLSS